MLKLKYCLTIALFFAIVLSSATDDFNTRESAATDSIPVIITELIDGTPFNADTLKGKMVVFNFWASYHATSRMNNYLLVELANTYKNRSFYNANGLEVVSISFDRFRSPLKRAIDIDGTESFYHICDYQGNESSLAKSFDISNPINILVDGEGKIIARGFELNEIESTLKLLAQN
jgi:thiol-disulfide isomerase/thioredoxin